MQKQNNNIFRTSLIVLSCLLMQYPCMGSWADYERYERDNDALLAEPLDGNRVVFMGDSITDAWVYQRPEFWADKPFVGRGIGGQTTGQMLLRFRQDVIDLNPSLVVILAGTNDLAENQGPTSYGRILGNLKSMAELAKVNGIKVIFGTILPAKDYPWRPGLSPDIKIPELNKLIKAYCEDQGIPVVDYFKAMVNEEGDAMMESLSEDGVHPNSLGYSIMETLVLEVIQTL